MSFLSFEACWRDNWRFGEFERNHFLNISLHVLASGSFGIPKIYARVPEELGDVPLRSLSAQHKANRQFVIEKK